MSASKVLVRGVLLLMLSVGILAAPLVLTVGGTGNVRAEQPAITLSLSGPAAGPSAASNALQPPRAPSTPGKAPAGQLLSYHAAPLQAPLTNIVISEFRTTGPNGPPDEFVELFNPTSASIDISGWTIHWSNCSGGGNLSATIPSIPSLLAGQHYLIGGTGYGGSVALDLNLGASNLGLVDDGGIAVENGSSTVVDAVGFCNVNAGDFYEGTPLATQVVTTADQSFERKFGGDYGSCLDNGDNLSDFALISPSSPQNSSVTPRPCVYPTISGSTGLAGVTLSYVEGLTTPKTVIAGTGGTYSIQVADGWTGTVTPTLAGYTFTPPSTTYTNVTGAATGQNYTATAVPSPTASPTATATATGGTPTPGSWPSLSVVINEVAWGGTVASTGDEWIELYHPGAGTVYLEGWRLVGVRAGGVTQFDITFADTTTDIISIGPGGYLVLAGNADLFSANVPVPWTITDPNFGLIDTGLTLYLYDPGGAQVDTANQGVGGSVSSWPAGNSTAASGRPSMERYRSTSSDSRSNWITWANPNTVSSAPLDRNGNTVRGTPGKANWASTVTVTAVPTATTGKKPTGIPPTPFAHMVINEILPRAGTDWNQDGVIDVYDEFIELKNLGPIDVDLRNWKLDDEQNAGSAPYTLPSRKLRPGERWVYYGSETKILLDDSGDAARLINPSGVVIDARTYGPVEAPDQSHCRIPDGYYWREPCFPTPGLENSLTGTAPAPPPAVAGGPPPCLLADSVPAPFRQAECSPYGADMWDETYWDKQAGQNQFLVPDRYNKATTIVQ